MPRSMVVGAVEVEEAFQFNPIKIKAAERMAAAVVEEVAEVKALGEAEGARPATHHRLQGEELHHYLRRFRSF